MAGDPLEREAEDPRCSKLQQLASISSDRHRERHNELRAIGVEVDRLRAERDDLARRLHGLAMLVREAEREQPDMQSGLAERRRAIGHAGRALSTRIAVGVARIVGGLEFAATMEGLRALLSKMERNVLGSRDRVRAAEPRMAAATDALKDEIAYHDGLVAEYRTLACRRPLP